MFQVVMQPFIKRNEKYHSFDSEIITIPLFKKFNLAVPYHFRKEDPPRRYLWNNHLWQILEKIMKNILRYTHSFLQNSFFLDNPRYVN